MSLSTDIGYVNDENGGVLEPKITPTLNKKDQIPANCTDKDLNDVIEFIKEDREQINLNEIGLGSKANQVDLEAVELKADTNKTNIDLLSIDLALKADSADLTTLEGRVDNIYSDYLTSLDKTELQGNIDLKANQTDLDNTEVKASVALAKANDNETAIANLPAEKTKTSELTNDGADGVNPFITADGIFDDKIKTVQFNFGTVTTGGQSVISESNYYEFEENNSYEVSISARPRFNKDTNMEVFVSFFGGAQVGLIVNKKANSQAIVSTEYSKGFYTHTASTASLDLTATCTNPDLVFGVAAGNINNIMDFIIVTIKKINQSSIPVITT